MSLYKHILLDHDRKSTCTSAEKIRCMDWQPLEIRIHVHARILKKKELADIQGYLSVAPSVCTISPSLR